jgi:hypothetical protein
MPTLNIVRRVSEHDDKDPISDAGVLLDQSTQVGGTAVASSVSIEKAVDEGVATAIPSILQQHRRVHRHSLRDGCPEGDIPSFATDATHVDIVSTGLKH